MTAMVKKPSPPISPSGGHSPGASVCEAESARPQVGGVGHGDQGAPVVDGVGRAQHGERVRARDRQEADGAAQQQQESPQPTRAAAPAPREVAQDHRDRAREGPDRPARVDEELHRDRRAQPDAAQQRAVPGEPRGQPDPLGDLGDEGEQQQQRQFAVRLVRQPLGHGAEDRHPQGGQRAQHHPPGQVGQHRRQRDHGDEEQLERGPDLVVLEVPRDERGHVRYARGVDVVEGAGLEDLLAPLDQAPVVADLTAEVPGRAAQREDLAAAEESADQPGGRGRRQPDGALLGRTAEPQAGPDDRGGQRERAQRQPPLQRGEPADLAHPGDRVVVDGGRPQREQQRAEQRDEAFGGSRPPARGDPAGRLGDGVPRPPWGAGCHGCSVCGEEA